jgi:hypothetical protein
MGGRQFHRQRPIDLLAFIAARVIATHSLKQGTYKAPQSHRDEERAACGGRCFREARSVGGNGDAVVRMRINPDMLDYFEPLCSTVFQVKAGTRSPGSVLCQIGSYGRLIR